MFDPIDYLSNIKPEKILESPNFLLTKSQLENFRNKSAGFFFSSFYKWAKKRIDVIPDVKSQDKYNREPIPKSGVKNIPEKYITKPDTAAVKTAINYLNSKHIFAENYGSYDDFDYPISHKSAEQELKHFLNTKLQCFGKYQDAINKNNYSMYHSVLSAAINIGLLQPSYIIEKLCKYQNKVPLSSYEGYIRQLIWREYQRYCYIYFKLPAKFNFSNNKMLTKPWYNGTLGIPPLDDAIKSAFKTGYLHHILRLMVVGNYMNLSGIKPVEGHRWFMEFSCDSYLWVMHQNVFEMVFFVAGKTMRKPYLSSSNYIIKMSNYDADPAWTDIWDYKYRKFILSNESIMKSYKWAYRTYPSWKKQITEYENAH